VDVLILVGAAALAFLAWRYPGRRCRSKFCEPKPKTRRTADERS